MTFNPTFLVNKERFNILAEKGLRHLSPEERARAEVPILGATVQEIRALRGEARARLPEHRQTFAELRAYCMFIGYPRSGHSLVGSLLDAHPEVIIGHELNALKFLAVSEFSAQELFWLLLENSRLFALCGRQWGDYRYGVPGQWQGTYRHLHVIGDKKGAGSTQLLAARPELLDRLRQTVKLPLRIVHITRNPYDNIATVARKDTGHLGKAVQFYLSLCEANRAIAAQLHPAEILHLRHEDAISDPRALLRKLCRFLGVSADTEYLDACAGVVKEKPSRPREKSEWTGQMRGRIDAAIGEFDFLRGYSFED
jgi:hypothetical protein